MTTPRNIRDVIGASLAVAYAEDQPPSLEFLQQIQHLLCDICATAPEIMNIRWHQFVAILQQYYGTNDEMQRVFSSPTHYTTWLERIPDEWKFVTNSDFMVTEHRYLPSKA